MMLPCVVSVQFPCVGQCHAINPWWALELLAVVLPTMVRGHGQFLYAFRLKWKRVWHVHVFVNILTNKPKPSSRK